MPTPASPATSSACGSPAPARSSALFRVPNSDVRPTNTGLTDLVSTPPSIARPSPHPSPLFCPAPGSRSARARNPNAVPPGHRTLTGPGPQRAAGTLPHLMSPADQRPEGQRQPRGHGPPATAASPHPTQAPTPGRRAVGAGPQRAADALPHPTGAARPRCLTRSRPVPSPGRAAARRGPAARSLTQGTRSPEGPAAAKPRRSSTRYGSPASAGPGPGGTAADPRAVAVRARVGHAARAKRGRRRWSVWLSGSALRAAASRRAARRRRRASRT